MNPINSLGVKVSALTGVVLVLLAVTYWGGQYAWQSFKGNSTEGTPQELAIAPERTDTDGDGLPDQFEGIYRTDQNMADTDGDGVNDFDEITTGRDPAVAGTQDESRPLTGEAVTGNTTYTERYLATLPIDAPRDAILDKTKLEGFIAANKGELLAVPAPSTVKTTTAEGKEAVAAYLDRIAPSHNPALAVVTNDDIQTAFAAQQKGDTAPLEGVINKLDQNIRILRTAEAPAEVTDLHVKLLAATESLLRNVQLVKGIREDFVGALVGSKNIEELGPVFQQIAQQIADLEEKYGLE